MHNSKLPEIMSEEQSILQLKDGFRDNKFTMPNIALTVKVMEMLSEELHRNKEVTILDFKNVLIDPEAANILLEIIKQNPQAEIINFNTGNDPFVDFIYHNLAQIRLKTLKLDVEVGKGSSEYHRILIDEHLANKIAELIKSNPDITRLDLRYVWRDSSAFEILANELKTNKSIKAIDLTPSELDTELFDGLKENKSVEKISIGLVTNEEYLERILDLLKNNKTIKYLEYITAINSETSRAILKILEQRQDDFEILLEEPNTNTFTMPAVSSIGKAMTILAQKIETRGDVKILDFRNVVINEEAAKELLSIIKKNPAIKVSNFNPGGDLFAKFISYNLSKISSDIIQLGVEAFGDPTGINIKLDATLATKIVELIESNTNIKTLNLYKCTIDDEALEILANELQRNDKIEVIDLTGNSLSDKKMGVLKNALKENKSIKKIIFNNAVLEGESLISFLSSQQITKAPNKAPIVQDKVTEVLQLDNRQKTIKIVRPITPELLDKLINIKHDYKTLSLPRTQEQEYKGLLRDVTLEEATDLAKILENFKDLTTIDFSHCRFAAGAIDVIAKSIENHSSISTIKLRDSEIDNNKLEILSPALKSIKYIDLSKNRIGNTGTLKRIADSNPDIVVYFYDNGAISMYPTQEKELQQIFKRRRKEELKKSLLDVISDIAIASNCSYAKDKDGDSDELFKLIRQYLKQLDADKFSIGVESSKAPGTIEEMIAKQKQEILDAGQTKIALKDVKLERKVQIIAILQIAADCLNDKNGWDQNLKQTKINKLENLLNTIDLSNASEDKDQQFLSQFLTKTRDIINEPKAEKTIVSQTDIDNYTKGQIVQNPPLHKRFKLEFLQKKLTGQALERNKRIEQILLRLDGTTFFFIGHEMDLATPEMLIDVAERLKNNQTVTSLNLEGIQITTQIAQALAKILETNTCIQHINLKNCQITDREAKILADGLKKNQGLKTLKIDHNNVTSAGVKYFQEALLLENQTLQHLSFGQIMGAQSTDYQDKIEQDPTFGRYCDKIEEYSIRNKLSNPTKEETVKLEKMITDERVDILVEMIEENNPNLKELLVPNVRQLSQESVDKIKKAFIGNTYLNSIILEGDQQTIIDSSVAPKQTEVEAQETPTVTDNTLQFGNESATVTKLGLDQANKITELLRDPSNKIKTLKLINCDISFESFRVIARQIMENKDIENIEFSQATKIDDQKREILAYALRENGHVITFSEDGTIFRSVKKAQDAQIVAAELTEDLDRSISVLQMLKLRYLKDALIDSAVNLAVAANCSATQDKLLKKDSDELFALIRGYFGKGAKDLKKYDIKITDIEPEEILKEQKDHIKGKYYSGSLDDPISLSKNPFERQGQMIAAIEIITEILGRDSRFFQIDESPIIEIKKLQRLFDLTSNTSLSSSVSEPELERDRLFLQQVFVKSLEKITQESDLKKTFVTQDEVDQYESYMSKLPPEKQYDYKKFKNQFLQTKFDSQERELQYRHNYYDESETQSSYDSDDYFDEQLLLEEEVQILIKVLQELDKKPDHEQKSAVQTTLCEAFKVSDMKSIMTMLNDLTLENRGKPQYERKKIEDTIGDDAQEFLEDISDSLRNDIKGSAYDPSVILDHIFQTIYDTKSNRQRKQMDDLGGQIMYLMHDLNTRFKKTTELVNGEVGPFAEYQLQNYSYYDGKPNTDQLSIEQILEEQKKNILANQKNLAKISLSLNPVIRRSQIIAVLEIIKDIKDNDSLMRLLDLFSEATNSHESMRQDKEFLDKVFQDSFQMITQELRLKEIENQKLATKTQQDKSSDSQNFIMPAIARPFEKIDKKKLEETEKLRNFEAQFTEAKSGDPYFLEMSKKEKFCLVIPQFIPGMVEILSNKLTGNTTIKELDLTGIRLDQKSGAILIEMLRSTSINSLILRKCEIDDTAMKMLQEVETLDHFHCEEVSRHRNTENELPNPTKPKFQNTLKSIKDKKADKIIEKSWENHLAETEEIPQPSKPNSRTRDLLSKLPNPIKTLKDMLAKREEEFSDDKRGLESEEYGTDITINPFYTGPLHINSSESGLESGVTINPLALHRTFQTQKNILKKFFKWFENDGKELANYDILRRRLIEIFDFSETEEPSLFEQLQEKINHDNIDSFMHRVYAQGGTKNIFRNIKTKLGNTELIKIYSNFEKIELKEQEEAKIERKKADEIKMQEMDLARNVTDQDVRNIISNPQETQYQEEPVSPDQENSNYKPYISETDLEESTTTPRSSTKIETVRFEDSSSDGLKLIRQRLQNFPDISIPTIKGHTFEELRKSVGGKVRINLPADLPQHLPVEFYLDGEESKLYEQINRTSELEWDRNLKTKGRDGSNHPRLISFAATIDKDNQVKYRTIVTEAKGIFVHFPSQDQIKQKDNNIKREFGNKIRDFNATDRTNSQEVTKSLEQKAIREFRQEEISKIGLKSHEILPISDIIQTYEEQYPSLKANLGDLASTMPPITEDPGFCIFRPRGKNIAQVVFNLDENSDSSTIDNVIYVSINGSGTKDQKPKYLRIRVGTFDGEVTETGKTLKKGEVYIYPETYSKACDPTSAIADKDLSIKDLKARKNFKVLAVGVTKGQNNEKQISSSIMLDGKINKKEVQAMDKIKQSITIDDLQPTLYL